MSLFEPKLMSTARKQDLKFSISIIKNMLYFIDTKSNFILDQSKGSR